MGKQLVSKKDSNDGAVRTVTGDDIYKYSLGFEFSEEALTASYSQMETILAKRIKVTPSNKEQIAASRKISSKREPISRVVGK